VFLLSIVVFYTVECIQGFDVYGEILGENALVVVHRPNVNFVVHGGSHLETALVDSEDVIENFIVELEFVSGTPGFDVVD
jgi:hypothetical protein